MSEVVVIGQTPIAVSGLPPQQVPGNLQTLSAEQLAARHAMSLAEVLNESLGSVNINDTQGNALQPDLNYRGFTASPILGTPQGIAVLIDGTRINEVFADTVNWDLIPTAALANVKLIPGANPLFGLDSTGGTLALTTKSGFQFPGSDLDVRAGSFGRHELTAEQGGHGARLDYYATATALEDNGWGDQNASRALQWFSKIGYMDEHNDADLSYTYSSAHVAANQTLPLSWLDTPRESYTWPDLEHDTVNFLNLQLRRTLGGPFAASLNLHERQITTNSFNSNVNDEFDPTVAVGPGNPPTVNIQDVTFQSRTGGTAELTWEGAAAGHRNELTLGVNAEWGGVDFSQLEQGAGATRDTYSTLPQQLQVLLHTRDSDLGLYVDDNLALGERTFLTVAGRYEDAVTTLEDRLGTALDGRHAVARLNPSSGLTFNPGRDTTLWLSIGESMRVPTPVELTCANALAPCTLPNAFSSDPGLRPVRSLTTEAGARGNTGTSGNLSIAVFQTRLDDDIEFISSGGGATSAGYFSNVGHTLRQGVELGADRHIGAVTLSARYSYLQARFESMLLLDSPDNTSSLPLACPTCTSIRVLPGDRIPGIPEHNARLHAEYRFNDRSALGIAVRAQSDAYARGDENNEDARGPVPGFVLLDADAHYGFGSGWQLYLKASNLLDRSYSNFGVLGENVFTGADRSFDASAATWRTEQFRSVGAPRGVWFGIEYRGTARRGTGDP